MQIEQVAVQLYTVRDYLKTPEDYQESLSKIADIGYRSVELAGPRPVAEAGIYEFCAEKGLVIAASHENPELILNDPHQVVENLGEFGSRYAAFPFPADVQLDDPEAVEQLIVGLARSGQILREAGKVLTYHNHAQELQQLNGVPVLERIYGQTEADVLQAELDTYWVHAGGSSPQAWCARLRDRIPLIHLKDYVEGPDGQGQFAEVGSGILDFQTIVATAEASGCQWFIVEQDTCPGDPFASIEASFRYIYDNLV